MERTGRHPGAYLMDGGFATREDITALEERDVTVYAPVKLPKSKPEEERYQPRYGDVPKLRWRQRMATEEEGGVPATRLHRRMGQCSSEPARGVPVHRPWGGQSHLSNAFGSGGP